METQDLPGVNGLRRGSRSGEMCLELMVCDIAQESLERKCDEVLYTKSVNRLTKMIEYLLVHACSVKLRSLILEIVWVLFGLELYSQAPFKNSYLYIMLQNKKGVHPPSCFYF